MWYIEDICFLRWKVEIYFIEWTPLVIFSRFAQPLVKILPMVFTRWNKFQSFTGKKDKYSVYFILLTLSGRSFIKIQYSSFPLFPVAYPFRIATQLQYYVKHKKFKVNFVIFPSGCEAGAINLGNKNMKIVIFTGGTSVRSKNIFTDISQYPTGKHEIRNYIFTQFWIKSACQWLMHGLTIQ